MTKLCAEKKQTCSPLHSGFTLCRSAVTPSAVFLKTSWQDCGRQGRQSAAHTLTHGAFSHKINFNFHIFIRSIQRDPHWRSRPWWSTKTVWWWLILKHEISISNVSQIFACLYFYMFLCIVLTQIHWNMLYFWQLKTNVSWAQCATRLVQHLILTLTAHQLTYIPLITHSSLTNPYTETVNTLRNDTSKLDHLPCL